MHSKIISSDVFNNMTDDEIKRFVIGYNDGQGDHGFATYSNVIEHLRGDSATPGLQLESMSRADILDAYMRDLDMNGNNSSILYFNGTEYQRVYFTD